MTKAPFTHRLRNAYAAFRGEPLASEKIGNGAMPLSAFWVSAAPWISRAVYTVTKLGIIESLHKQPATAATLAAESSLDAAKLKRLLTALAGCGILARRPDEHYALTELSEPLVATAEYSLKHWTLLLGESWREANRGMAESISNGKSGFECVFGSSMWEYYESAPQDRATFDAAMNEVTLWQSKAIAEAVSLQDANQIVDVGCGKAALLSELLVQNPHLRGTGLDRESGGDALHQEFIEKGIAGRARVETGSFFEADQIPKDGDVYFIKHVLHDWDDEHAAAILAACRKAMPPKASIKVIEGVRGRNSSTDFLLDWLDIEQMMVTESGRERSETDFRELFRGAGLTLTDIQDSTVADASILTAVQVDC